jgi:hypothetical protein
VLVPHGRVGPCLHRLARNVQHRLSQPRLALLHDALCEHLAGFAAPGVAGAYIAEGALGLTVRSGAAAAGGSARPGQALPAHRSNSLALDRPTGRRSRPTTSSQPSNTLSRFATFSLDAYPIWASARHSGSLRKASLAGTLTAPSGAAGPSQRSSGRLRFSRLSDRLGWLRTGEAVARGSGRAGVFAVVFGGEEHAAAAAARWLLRA